MRTRERIRLRSNATYSTNTTASCNNQWRRGYRSIHSEGADEVNGGKMGEGQTSNGKKEDGGWKSQKGSAFKARREIATADREK